MGLLGFVKKNKGPGRIKQGKTKMQSLYGQPAIQN